VDPWNSSRNERVALPVGWAPPTATSWRSADRARSTKLAPSTKASWRWAEPTLRKARSQGPKVPPARRNSRPWPAAGERPAIQRPSAVSAVRCLNLSRSNDLRRRRKTPLCAVFAPCCAVTSFRRAGLVGFRDRSDQATVRFSPSMPGGIARRCSRSTSGDRRGLPAHHPINGANRSRRRVIDFLVHRILTLESGESTSMLCMTSN
jgi:hypothetical protein